MKNNELNMLVGMLHQASKLEHCLLNAYLFTASSIKSMPEEFALLSDGRPNLRKSIQFEKARQWKQSMLGVSHEEMLHLHYVQCLLRALDKAPSFELPPRKEDSDAWLIANWDIYEDSKPGKEGTEVPLADLTIEQIKQFVLFESTDSMQDDNPFGANTIALFQQLFDFELDFHLEGMLYNIADDDRRNKLKASLKDVYLNMPVTEEATFRAALAKAQVEIAEEDLKYVRFQSIGDFYTKGILPLYRQAFDAGKVPNSNLAFNNEMQGFDAGEGFLPVGPVYRSKNYTDFSSANAQNALRYFKNVESIVNEIVDEGEGFSSFETMAADFMAQVAKIGGTRKYLEFWKVDQKNARNKAYTTPQWLADAELCRQSHLYRFIMVYMDMEFEKKLCEAAGVDFVVHRQPLQLDPGNHAMEKFVHDLPRQFNSCYLVMLLWLSRLYEVKLWQTDKDRRYAIEMIATWPMMSLAIRPFLELISFFSIDKKVIFRIEKDSMPSLPTEAAQLVDYFKDTERSEEINKQIDYLAMRVLANVGEWAQEQMGIIRKNLTGNDAEMVLTRLTGLSRLGEFEKQFPFRAHGGYSNQMPDLNYQQEFPDADRYSEDPSTMDAVFEDSLVLKLRFGGFGLVQLSTDPDPPTDESGCTGTHMLHAADGDRRFDRALVFQDVPGAKNILRDPRQKLPELGVNVIDLTLQVTDGAASAGFVPLQIMQSAGAVQTSGVQQFLQVTGLNDLASYPATDIVGDGAHLRLNLLDKNNTRPFLNGDNHLVSKDGEPIDPFVLAITDDKHNNIFRREIYNEGKTLLDMNPLQRLETARWPTGFDSDLTHIPTWLQKKLPDGYISKLMQGPRAYLAQRADTLTTEIENLLTGGIPHDVDTADTLISYAERLALVSMPRGTTVGWLAILLNYGHSVSGEMLAADSGNPIYDFIEKQLNVKVSCTPTAADRSQANTRWVVKYTKGIMDTDAISDMVFGELYIPLQVTPDGRPFNLHKKWTFVAGMKDLITSYATDFSKPFWGNYQVEGNTRTTTLANGTELSDTLTGSDATGYNYKSAGIEGLGSYEGSLKVATAADGSVELTLAASYQFETAQAFNAMVSYLGSQIKAMSAGLAAHFAPES